MRLMRDICVLGIGFIGLPTALLLAQCGNRVTGFDINKNVVRTVNKGISHLKEGGVSKLLEQMQTSQAFHAATELEESDVFIIAVPTPLDQELKCADLRAVESAVSTVRPFLRKGNLVIVESTIPVGTSELRLIPELEKSGLKANNDFNYAYCPERAMPSNLLHEIVHSDRIIGAMNERSATAAKAVYSCFVKGDLYSTRIRTAELCKIIENAYRDINIAFANELAKQADENEVDIWETIALANKHPRVNILRPGPGVGGHCVAVDPWFLCQTSSSARLVALAREINDSMPRYIIDVVGQLVGTQLPTITILGAAYKANVNDCRESPSLMLIVVAKQRGWNVKIHDPYVKDCLYPMHTLKDAASGSDCIILATDHDSFKNLDPEAIGPLMRQKNIIDTRNALDQKQWENAGFTYRLLGRWADSDAKVQTSDLGGHG